MAETRSPVPPTPPRADSFSTGQTLVNQTGQTAPSPYEKHRLQEVTVEGYRTLGVVSTFIAGVESQCIGLVSDYNGTNHPRLREASSALLLIGLSLSTLGAALSLLSARWFDLLRADQLKMLEYRWDCAVKKAEAGREKHNSKVGDTSKAESTSKEAPKDDSLKDSHTATPNIRKHIDEFNASNWRARWRDNLMAFAIRSPVPVVFCLQTIGTSGFFTFIVGMVLYTWLAHKLATAIANTIIAALGTFLILCMHLRFSPMVTLQLVCFDRMTLPV